MALVRVDLALDRMHVGDGREVEIFAPDKGRELLQERFARVKVARHRARLDEGGALPVLAHAFVIGERGLERDRDRRRAGVGTQPQIGAEDVAVARAFAHDLDDAFRQLDEEVDVLGRIGGARAGAVEEHDDVDVGGIVELIGAALAHAEKNPAGPALGVALVGKFELPGERRRAQGETDGCGKRRVGDAGQRGRGGHRVPNAGEVGERDDERGLLLDETKIAHKLRFIVRVERLRRFDQRLDPAGGVGGQDGGESPGIPCGKVGEIGRRAANAEQELACLGLGRKQRRQCAF